MKTRNYSAADLQIAWVRCHSAALGSEEYEDSAWSFAEVWTLTRDRPRDAFQFILDVCKLSPSSRVIESLAAGPMEDLLRYHGDEVIPWVENAARENRVFSKVLGGVWQRDIGDRIWGRIEGVRDSTGWDAWKNAEPAASASITQR